MSSFHHGLRLASLASACLALATTATGQVQFTNVSNAAMVGGPGFATNTNHGLGVSCVDINRDGWPDLFCVNGKGKRPHLFLNKGDGTFQQRDDLLPTLPAVEMPGAVFADYDNDGDSDIFIATDNHVLDLNGLPAPNPQDGPPDILLKNLWVELGSQAPLPGQKLFVNVAVAAGVDDLPPVPFPSITGSNFTGYRSISASWLDFDRDGFVDLYVGHWACTYEGQPSNRDSLYRNKGDGTFEDVTEAMGLPTTTSTAYLRPNLSSTSAQLDQDLWPDMYWGQAQCTNVPVSVNADLLWRNTGTGIFVEAQSESPGIGDDSAAPMGLSIGDIDLDGDWDVYITDTDGTTGPVESPLGNTLYVNNGNATFTDNTAPDAGISGEASWPATFFDADLDGYEDLFLGVFGENAGLNRLWMNNGDGTFADVGAAAQVQDPGNDAKGSAVLDYDRDGDLDLVVIYDGGKPMSLFRNDTVTANHWLALELAATTSNRDAIGAVVKVSAGGLSMMRQIVGGSSGRSESELAVHFGLGTATQADSVEVFWPSGLVTHLEGVAADQYVTVTEAPQYFAAYGSSCSGAAPYAPSLIASGAAQPGGTIALDIVSAHGGGSVFYVLGMPQTSPGMVGGCPLYVQAPISVYFGGTLDGSGNGHGASHVTATLPISTPTATIALQAFVVHPAIPGLKSSTNAVQMDILP